MLTTTKITKYLHHRWPVDQFINISADNENDNDYDHHYNDSNSTNDNPDKQQLK